MDDKARLRERVREIVRGMNPNERVRASVCVCEGSRQDERLRSAALIVAFAPLPSEPDITPIAREAIAAGKTVCVPRLSPSDRSMEAAVVRDWEADLVSAPVGSGVREPRAGLGIVPAERLEVVFVPGLAFDLEGGRLGRGAGYYDRFLSRCTARARFVGVCFDEQIVDRVPMEPHDVRMHAVLTPSGLRGVPERVG